MRVCYVCKVDTKISTPGSGACWSCVENCAFATMKETVPIVLRTDTNKIFRIYKDSPINSV